MREEIEISGQDFPDKYSKLQKYDQSEFSMKKNQAIKAYFEEIKFENMRFKSGRYEGCTFENCDFYEAGLSGTHFISCKLNDCDIDDCNMQFCEFSQKSKLRGISKKVNIRNSNLSQSMFCDCELEKLNFKSTTISQARFSNVSFREVYWESCTLQDNIFENIEMQEISLVGCNLEHSVFKNVTFKNKVDLPFHQIPYAFGLLECLAAYPDDTWLGSVTLDEELIPSREYLDLLPDLFSYYLEMEEYFPAINIALFSNNYDEINSLIETGLQHYIRSKDFRKIKGICRLIAANSSFDKHYMVRLYFKLVEYYNIISVNEYDRYQYSLHINDIKKILTEFDDTNPEAQLYLKTNITSADTDKLGFFYQFIEQCLGDYGISNEEYYLEIRHNSDPLSFWVTLSQSDPRIILRAIGMLLSIIVGNPELFQTAIGIIGSIATIGSFALQIGEVMKGHKKVVESNSPQIESKDLQYMKTQNQMLKSRKISVEIALPFFKFNYQNEKQCESQN